MQRLAVITLRCLLKNKVNNNFTFSINNNMTFISIMTFISNYSVFVNNTIFCFFSSIVSPTHLDD